MINNNGTFCTTTVRKKRRENHVTSGHVTDVTSGYGSLPVTRLTSLPVMTSLPVTQSSSSSTHRVMMKNPIIFWKLIIVFFYFIFENLYTVKYFMLYSHCYCCLCHVNRIHTCNTINIVIGHQLFNDDFINDGKCFTT